MAKALVFLSAIALSGAAFAQQSQPQPDANHEAPNTQEQSAAAGGTGARCDFMSREEMLMCQATRPGDVSGGRSTWCDSVSAEIIERCLTQQESISSDPANEFRNREGAAGSG